MTLEICWICDREINKKNFKKHLDSHKINETYDDKPIEIPKKKDCIKQSIKNVNKCIERFNKSFNKSHSYIEEPDEDEKHEMVKYYKKKGDIFNDYNLTKKMKNDDSDDDNVTNRVNNLLSDLIVSEDDTDIDDSDDDDEFYNFSKCLKCKRPIEILNKNKIFYEYCQVKKNTGIHQRNIICVICFKNHCDENLDLYKKNNYFKDITKNFQITKKEFPLENGEVLHLSNKKLNPY